MSSSELLLGQRGKYFGDFSHQVLTICPSYRLQLDLVPSLIVLVLSQYVELVLCHFDIQLLDGLVPSRVIKVRNRKSALSLSILSSVRSRFIKPSSHFFQNITNVDHKCVRDGIDGDPGVVDIFYLQSFVANHQNSKQSIVTMLSNSPQILVCIRVIRIVKNAHKSDVVFGDTFSEKGSIKIKRFCNCFHQHFSQAIHLLQPKQDIFFQSRRFLWKQIRTMKRSTICNFLVVFVQLLTQVETFLQVNFSTGKFLSHLKIASPCPTTFAHFDCPFFLSRKVEKLFRMCQNRFLQLLRNTVIFDIEEPGVFAGMSDSFSNFFGVVVGQVGLKVDDRNTHH